MKDGHSDNKAPFARREEAPASKKPDYPVQICEVCETEMYGLHCKIVCPKCGYKRDCSDP